MRQTRRKKFLAFMLAALCACLVFCMTACKKKPQKEEAPAPLEFDERFPAMKNGRPDFEAYFEKEGADCELSDYELTYTLTQETATLTFVRPLVSNGFRIIWNGQEGNKLSEVTYTLTDASDEESSIAIGYKYLSDSFTAVNVDGSVRSYMISGNLTEKNAANFNFTLDEETCEITDGAAFSAPVEKFTDGTLFGGFAGGKVLLTIRLCGEVGSKYLLCGLNGQNFGAAYTSDSAAPWISIESGQVYAGKNTIVDVPKGFALDVLSNVTYCNVTVRAPNNDVVKDIKGRLLDERPASGTYRIRTAQYGVYRMFYTASDGKNTARAIFYITVKDTVPPVISLGQWRDTVAVGEKFNLPIFTATDEGSETVELYVTVKFPTGKVVYVDESITFDTPGRYQFVFSAIDEEGNIAKIEKYLNVTGVNVA